MRVICGPSSSIERDTDADIRVTSYESGRNSVGGRIPTLVRKNRLQPSARAWDLLSIALAVVSADLRVPRNRSADGWTREITLSVGVGSPDFWNSVASDLCRVLQFLTTDVWSISFFRDDRLPFLSSRDTGIEQDSVVLLSGGLDSLVGVIDLTRGSRTNPFAVSQKAAGESQLQTRFAKEIGLDLAHIQFNQLQNFPGQREGSQRSRSMAFLSYGVLVATALPKASSVEDVPLFVCENGFISLNPPLTDMRLGSLSTRTTHPAFLSMFQHLLDIAEIRVRLTNPYQLLTKGEMLRNCSDLVALSENASMSISCGRFSRHNWTHCGRCLPCLIRRAAFSASPIPDATRYRYNNLSRRGSSHASFDDVRAAVMAVTNARDVGDVEWAHSVLEPVVGGNSALYVDVIARGIGELGTFLDEQGVQ